MSSPPKTAGEARQPRYEQIAAHLRSLVAVAQPGDRLPSDAELCAAFGVSRMTARQAVQLLVSEGLVHRSRGAGTFVAPKRVQRLLGSPMSFSESMSRRGMSASSRLIRRGATAAPQDVSLALGLESGDRAYRLERLRLADGTPMAIETVMMPVALAESLEGDIETGSLHEAFRRAGRHPTKALAAVTARRATRREKEQLNLSPPNDVLLCETRTIWDQDGSPLERTRTCYVADRYAFEALIEGQGQ